MTISWDPEEKAKRFLRDVMGQETYNKFIKEGKTEIKSGDCLYELTTDGKVINKTKNQSYCIVLSPGTPDRDSIPIYDLIAVKYCWLKYGTRTVEIVANKTNIYNPHEIEPGRGGIATYDEFVRHMEDTGWVREQLTIHETIHEHNNSIASTHNINAGEIGSAIEIRVPAGRTITIMGTRQVPRELPIQQRQGRYGFMSREDREPESYAHKLAVRLTDAQDNDIAPETNIEIVKERPTTACTRIARLPYYHICQTRNNLYTTIQRRDEYYAFRDGIWLGSNNSLKINVINPDRDIKNVKFGLDLDFWSREY